MNQRLAQLYERLQDCDNIDGAVAAISELEAEATSDWLPDLHEWLLRPGDFFLRESVAPAVIRLEGIACLPRLISALHLGFDEGHDCDSLQGCVFALMESSPASAARILGPLADSPDPADRTDAAWLLGFVSSEVSPDIFVRLASDSSANVRRAACGSLRSLKGFEPAFDALVQCLSDADEDVRIAAVSSLDHFGDRRGLPLLERYRQQSSERVVPMLEFSPSVRWTLTPFLVVFAVVIPFLLDEWSIKRVGIAVVLEMLVVALLLGLWTANRISRIVLRLVSLLVFLGYVGYLMDELRSGKEITMPHSKSETSPVNAVFGLLCIGLPALKYALTGCFSICRKDEASDEDSKSGEEH